MFLESEGKSMSGFETLEEDLRKKKFMDIAKTIIQYQNFKNVIACSKMSDDLGKSTKNNYLNYGIKYLKKKTKVNLIPKILYQCLDEWQKKCLQPLTPSFEDRKIQYNLKKKHEKKDAILPVNKVIEDINTNIRVTAEIKYGIKLNDEQILLMKNRDYALGFANGLKHCGKTDVKVITLEIGDISE